jgi:hypothetical protein
MSPEIVKVAILGAAGESAGQIVSGLLDSMTPIYVGFITPGVCKKCCRSDDKNNFCQ